VDAHAHALAWAVPVAGVAFVIATAAWLQRGRGDAAH
jgi:hypothetical protein